MNSELKKNIRNKKRAGVSFPLISILSRKSFGVGDIFSLKILSDWAKESGISIIQILPLNDLGYGRSPYSSISAFAIDPIYISFHLMGIEDISSDLKNIESDRLKIKQKKLDILKAYFDKIFNAEVKKSTEEFINQNSWLNEYIAFSILNQQFKGIHWTLWQREYSSELLESLIKEKGNTYYFLAWIQLILYSQLKSQKSYMESNGVYLKGDMPILTSDHSADVWAKPTLFNRDLSSGAPPDYFNSEGQNWGFPVIDWKEMKKQKYSWWKDRLGFLGNFYHLYRIDHVLGMYRIWGIPKGRESAKFGFFHPQIGVSRKEFNLARLFPEDFEKLGLIFEFKPDHYIFYWDFFKTSAYQSLPEEIKARFYPLSNLHLQKDEEHWRKAGDEILSFLFENSDMVPCAEDLGAVPSFVRDSIHDLQLLGLDIIRWTRSFEDGSYIKPPGYRKNAVSALSVHDTSTALGWWQECSPEDRNAFKKLILPDKKEPNENSETKDPSNSQLAGYFLNFAFSCASQYSIHMLQDYIISGYLGENRNGVSGILTEPLKHRINVPGTPEDKNWGYIFPFLAEELLEEKELITSIRELITMNGRLT